MATATHIPVPEPKLTAEEIVDRAHALSERLMDEAADTEERGTYSDELHDQFVSAGFHRILQPGRIGRAHHGPDHALGLRDPRRLGRRHDDRTRRHGL